MRTQRLASTLRTLLVAGVFTTFAVRTEAADPPDEATRRARALADDGANAYARDNHELAHELLARAYAIVPAPTIAVLDARALVRLGRLVQARSAYERAVSTTLEDGAPEAFRIAIGEARAELTALEPRVPKCRIELRGGASDSTRVYLDGRPLPRSSLGTFIAADPGLHEVRTGEGTEARAVAFELREGEVETVRIDVATEANASAPRTASIVAFGVGAAGLAFGISTGIVAVNAHQDAERGCPGGTCERGSAGAEASQRFETYRTLSMIGYGIAVAGAGTGAVLWLTGSNPSRSNVALVSTFRDVRLEGTF